MPRYSYLARDSSGNQIDGVLEAASDLMVLIYLRRQDLFPVSVSLVGGSPFSYVQKIRTSRVKKGRVSLKELALFTRQSAVMVAAGISIVVVLEDLASQTPNRYFSFVLENIKKDIQKGSGFSEALKKYPKIFTPLYVALITSGEESGSLAEVMAEMADNLESQLALNSKLRQALSYPVVVLLFFMAVVLFVFLFLLPQFQRIFQGFGASLPAFTVAVLNISSFLMKFLPFALAGVVFLGISFFFWGKTSFGREKIDTVKLKVPLMGPLMLKVGLARFASSLATLLAGGVSLVSALEIVSKTAGNRAIEKRIQKVEEGVIQGSLITAEMRKYRIFSPLLVRMVAVGEETGKMEEMLNRAARFFRDEVDATLNILTSILEPVLIVGMGVVVGVVVLAIYLPIFNIAGAMR